MHYFFSSFLLCLLDERYITKIESMQQSPAEGGKQGPLHWNAFICRNADFRNSERRGGYELREYASARSKDVIDSRNVVLSLFRRLESMMFI